MDLQFSGEVWHWRGPSPYHFVTVPDGEAEAIKEVSGRVSYGWGVIPVTARIEDTEWTTSPISTSSARRTASFTGTT